MPVNPATLSLQNIVDIVVLISPQAAPRYSFNQGLIIGTSSAIPNATRIKQYQSAAAMLSDGFSSTSHEYEAALLYFDQQPTPNILWVGRQDLTAIYTIAPHSANEGSGYQVGDILTVIQSGATGGTVEVSTVGGGGNVTGLTIVTQGTGYSIQASLLTSDGHGTGCEVDISAIGETPLQSLQACRSVNYDWYMAMCTES